VIAPVGKRFLCRRVGPLGPARQERALPSDAPAMFQSIQLSIPLGLDAPRICRYAADGAGVARMWSDPCSSASRRTLGGTREAEPAIGPGWGHSLTRP
jgi:hypothetical protein